MRPITGCDDLYFDLICAHRASGSSDEAQSSMRDFFSLLDVEDPRCTRALRDLGVDCTQQEPGLEEFRGLVPSQDSSGGKALFPDGRNVEKPVTECAFHSLLSLCSKLGRQESLSPVLLMKTHMKIDKCTSGYV